MPGPVAAIAASGALSAGAGLIGSNKAAKASEAGTQAQIALQERIFDQQREDQTPWREVGSAAITALGEGLETGEFTMDDWQFQADPGYAFRQAEGQKYLDNSAAARGNLLSGAQLKAGVQYNQNLASDEYQRAFSRERGVRADKFNFLSGAAGAGQVAVQSTNADASRMASSTGQAIQTNALNQANIQSSMYGNLAASGNQAVSNYLTYKMVG